MVEKGDILYNKSRIMDSQRFTQAAGIDGLGAQMRRRTKECPVAGHNSHGAVEHRIGIIQEGLKKIQLDQKRVHVTGLQTLFKVIESEMNSTTFALTEPIEDGQAGNSDS